MKKMILIISIFNFAITQNYSLQFDGIDDNVLLPNKPIIGIQNEFSILSYINANTLNSQGTVYMHGGDYNDVGLMIREKTTNDYQICFYLLFGSGNQGFTWAPINTNKWYFIAATYDGQTMKLYVDGELIDENEYVANVNWDTGNSHGPCIGGGTDSDSPWIHGYIDNISFWTTAYNQEEIQQIMSVEFNGNENDLSGYYNFNEGSGSILFDLSDNDNHGTINGAVYSDNVPILGCTHPDAENYNESADVDDGTCVFDNLNAGLVAYYPFNGNANDESGNGNDGVVDGAILTSDRFENENSAFSFDGENDVLTISDHPTLVGTNILTISTFINLNTDNGLRVIAAKYDPEGDREYQLSVENGYLRWWISNDGINGAAFTSESQIDINKWLHITSIFSNGFISFYVDGILQFETDTNIYTIYDGNSQISIGGSFDQSNYYFPGEMDDIRIYNRTLTETEIKELYCEGGWCCTDPAALNHQPEAAYDDGESCIYQDDLLSGKNFALGFDGVDDYVETLPISFSPPFTMQFWLKPNDITQETQNIVNLWENGAAGLELRIKDSNDEGIDGRLTYTHGFNGNTVRLRYDGLENDQWYNCTVKCIGNGTAYLYINGQLIVSDGGAGTGSVITPITFGGYGPNPTDDNFNGKLEDIRIWNRSLPL